MKFKLQMKVLLTAAVIAFLYSTSYAKPNAYDAEKTLFFNKWKEVEGCGAVAGWNYLKGFNGLYVIGDLYVPASPYHGLGFFFGYTYIHGYGEDPYYRKGSGANDNKPLPLITGEGLDQIARTAIGFKLGSPFLGVVSAGVSIEQSKGYPEKYLYVDELSLRPLIKYDLKVPFIDLKAIYQAKKTMQQLKNGGGSSKPMYMLAEAAMKIMRYRLIPYLIQSSPKDYQDTGVEETGTAAEETDNEKDNPLQQIGLKQEFVIPEINGFIRFAVDNTYLKNKYSISEAYKQKDNYTYRFEAVWSPVYVGVWHNKELGTGYGAGLGYYSIKNYESSSRGTETTALLAFKWNEITPDPAYDRAAGFSINLEVKYTLDYTNLGKN